MSQPEIVMYVRRNCGDVDYARRVLADRELDWTEVDIDRDADGLKKVIEWNGGTGRSPTPTVWIGNTMLVEPDEDDIDEALAKETGE
jgi:glutaredoxin